MDFWSQLQVMQPEMWMAGFAQRYGNTPNIMYEPWNEPTTDSWATIKAYMQTNINAIRPYDSNNIIILDKK
jgi:endoglucanase